ncbi:MAG TPA: Gfo/Idh/MocA family oxidoreductase [Armatimonadota bacterium]|jgi:predicted dehydrogenase
MLRIALIGAGKTVTVGHAPALQALHDRFQVVGIADRSPEALEAAGILLGVAPEHRYHDYRDLLTRETIDVVSIALPHAFHHEVTLAALQAGVHVLTERPLALSMRDAEEIIRLAEIQGKLVTVLHYYLYYPPFREAIRQVAAGAIGEPFLVRCEGVTGGSGPGTATYHPAWHGNQEIAGGGVWIDSGYHNAYLCVSLQGAAVATVSAQIGTFATELSVDDTAVALLTHRNGSISNVQVAWSVPSGGQRVFEVYGTEGTLTLDHEGYPLGIFSNATRSWQHPEINLAHAQSFIDFYQALYECLRFGAPPPVSHRDALHTLNIVTAGYRASEEGRVETVEDWGTHGSTMEDAA